MKRLLILLAVLFLAACSEEELATEGLVDRDDPSEEQTEEVESMEEESEPVEEELADDSEAEQEEEATEEDSDWDEVKNQDNIVGKSDKDFSELKDTEPTDVRNDTTGNWRKITISENVDITEYALSYSDLHMNEGEVHHIINFGNDTTTWLNEMGGLLYVDVKEYVEDEEHDASTLGSGMTLKSYVIYPDGDIEEIE